MTPATPTTLPYRARAGNLPARLEVKFHQASGSSVIGPDLHLTAGAVGTWEFRITVKTPVPEVAGGGFLFERYGFLLSHSVQNTRPRGRDYVTVHSSTQAQVRLEINELNQAHWPSFARIVVERGTLNAGRRAAPRGRRHQPGRTRQRGLRRHLPRPHRRVGGSQRHGLDYRQLSGGEIPVHVSSDPTPTLLRLLGPSIARPGEPFALHLAAYDRNHNVCTQYTGTVELSAEASQLNGLPREVRLGPKDAGFAIIQGVTAQTPGLVRIEAHDRAHALSTLSNPLLVQSDPETLLLWGDLHSHSWGDISMGLMDDPTPVLHPAGRHAQARGQARLDFAAPGPMAPPDQTQRPAVWEAHQAAYRANDAPGRYVPFLAAEAHPNVGGDRNVIFRDWAERYAPAFADMDYLVETYGEREDVNCLKPTSAAAPPTGTPTRWPTSRWSKWPAATGPLNGCCSARSGTDTDRP